MIKQVMITQIDDTVRTQIDEVKFLSLRCYDNLLKNPSKYSKNKILAEIRNLRDRIDRDY